MNHFHGSPTRLSQQLLASLLCYITNQCLFSDRVERSGSGVELQTLDYENLGSNQVPPSFCVSSTLLQFTQLYERVPGYRQWWIFIRAAFVYKLQQGWIRPREVEVVSD